MPIIALLFLDYHICGWARSVLGRLAKVSQYEMRLGIAIDLLVYSVVIPVMPFQLERLQYSNVAALTGWLLFAFASPHYRVFPVDDH